MQGAYPTLAKNYDHYVTYDSQSLFRLHYQYNIECISARHKDRLTEAQAIEFAPEYLEDDDL